MFSLTPQTNRKNPQESFINKQIHFRTQSSRKQRQNILNNARYLHNLEVLEWRVDINTFLQKINGTTNYFTLLNTLFAISQELQWRRYIAHMTTLVSKFHNITSEMKGAIMHDISKMPYFQEKFHHLFLLKDMTLHAHLMLLLKMILAFNPKYCILKEEKISIILAQSSTYNSIDVICEILWILAQINVSTVALVKLFRLQNLSQALQKAPNKILLPFLCIMANFLANSYNPQLQEIVSQLINSQLFKKALSLGIEQTNLDIRNQAILVFNNAICLPHSFIKETLIRNQIIKKIKESYCQEGEKCMQILSLIGIQALILNNQQKCAGFLEEQTGFHQFSASSETAMGQ